MAELHPRTENLPTRNVDLPLSKFGRCQSSFGDSEIPLNNIPTAGTPKTIWSAILEEAKKRNRLGSLIQVAYAEYGENEVLKNLMGIVTDQVPNPGAEEKIGPDKAKAQELIDKIRSIIQLDDDLLLAIDQMLKLTREVDALDRMENDVIALSGRLNSLNRQNGQGVLPASEFIRQTNVLRQSIIGTLDRLETRLSF